MKIGYKILKYRYRIAILILFFGILLDSYSHYYILLGFLSAIFILGITKIYLDITEFKFEFYDRSTGDIIEYKNMTGLRAYHYSKYTGYGARLITDPEVGLSE